MFNLQIISRKDRMICRRIKITAILFIHHDP